MKTRLTALAILTFISTVTPAAFANSIVPFSPYADLTLETHWDSKYQAMEPIDLTLISQKSGIKIFHLAFITDSGSCAPAWGGQSSFTTQSGWASHLTDKLRAQNIAYVISFGGASDSDISKACSSTQLLNAYEQIIRSYQPQGFDFDIENGTADVGKVMQTLQQVQKAHPNLVLSFTLPVLPEGLVASGQDVVNQAKAANLNFKVNIMAMDFGPAYNKDMGQYAIQAATSLFNFLKSLYPEKTDAALWAMIEVTPMIGVNDVSVEEFTLPNVDTLGQFAKEKGLGGLSFWSITRDKPCADKWATPVCSGNNLQTKPYEFSQRFLQFS